MRHLGFMGRWDHAAGRMDPPRVHDHEIVELRKTLDHEVPMVFVRVRADVGEMSAARRKVNADYLAALEKDGKCKIKTGQVTKHHPDGIHGWIEPQFTVVGKEPKAVSLKTALLLLAQHPDLIEECDEPGTESDESEDTNNAPPPRRRR